MKAASRAAVSVRKVTFLLAHQQKHRRLTVEFCNALKLLGLFERRRWISIEDIVTEFGICSKTARRWLAAAEDAGWPIWTDKDGRFVHYTIRRT